MMSTHDDLQTPKRASTLTLEDLEAYNKKVLTYSNKLKNQWKLVESCMNNENQDSTEMYCEKF